MFCMARHCVAVLFSVCKNRKPPCGRLALTDEVFAAATAKLVRNNRRWSENWMIGIAFSSWSSWVFGTVIGAFSGSGLLQGYPPLKQH